MKPIGMIHIKGVNDAQWNKFISEKKEIAPTGLTLCNRKK
jgi:hypothetical protein